MTVKAGNICKKCGAKRIDNQLGLEATPELYRENTVAWAREVGRVLRKDGTCWLNLGDSYCHDRLSSPMKGDYSGDDSLYQRRADYVGSEMPKRTNGTYKTKDLMGMPWKVAFALQTDGWYLRSAMPWVKRCLSGGTMIHARTQKGIMPTNLKDLYRLKPETVKLWNGKQWTQLKGMTKQPRKGNEIEIFLRSGERISCTPDHRWPVGKDLKDSSELKVGDILKRCTLAYQKKRTSHLPHQLIGKFVGLYIAEGCKDKSIIHISGHKKEKGRREFLQNIVKFYDGTMTVQNRAGNSQNINLSGRILFGILDDYVAGSGSHGKHLTTKAWQRGNKFLRSVLDGYLWGDGHYDKKNDRWRLGFCNNDSWVSDLRSICARLNVSLRLKRTIHKNQTGEFKGYKGELRFDLSDKSINSGNFKKLNNNEIIKIGKPRARHYYDVEVEDEPHLFSLASGILTHNSAMPESCTDRPASALEYMFLLTKSSKYYFDMDAIRVEMSLEQSRKNQVEIARQNKIRKNGGIEFQDSMINNKCIRKNEYESNATGRNFRNTDLFYQSLK